MMEDFLSKLETLLGQLDQATGTQADVHDLVAQSLWTVWNMRDALEHRKQDIPAINPTVMEVEGKLVPILTATPCKVGSFAEYAGNHPNHDMLVFVTQHLHQRGLSPFDVLSWSVNNLYTENGRYTTHIFIKVYGDTYTTHLKFFDKDESF